MGVDSRKAENIVKGDWSIASSVKYYGLKNWGKGHFQIDEEGYLKVLPLRDSKGIRIFDIVQEAKSKGYDLPMTIRIQDLLQTRVKELNETFNEALIDSKTGKRKNFFNLGPKNDWKKFLDDKNKNKIEEKFRNEMIELGYL